MADKPSRPNRVKIISIDERFFVDVLNWWRNPPTWLGIPVTEELPEDCEILRVWVSHERRRLEALVYSSHFPICDDDTIPERIPGTLREVRAVPFGQVIENEVK
jgi:hypothetical protein